MRVPLAVIAAHPDDETIGAAGLLLRAGGAVVVHVTDGAPRDPALRPAGSADRAAYARLRRDEALAALAEARLDPADVVSLGIVDQEAASSIAAVALEVARLLRALRPRLAVTHALEGGHPDHDAVALAVRVAAALLARDAVPPARVVEMTGYHRHEGRLRTGTFLGGGAPVRERVLSGADRRAKRRMLSCYASQRDVLAPFGVDVERFRDAPAVALPARPHSGPLHYEALGWATFASFRDRAEEALASLGFAAAAREAAR